MLHLKLPLKKWDYLKKRFGLILRPDSWIAAEGGMRQCDSQPKQSAADETTQGTHNSHNELENPPSREKGIPDCPNDCAETESRYLTPETEVVDMQGVENNLPVEEEGLLDSKNDWTEIPTGYLEPKMDIVDVQWTELDEHADTLEVPDERSQHTDDDTAEH
ncbi:hypothetical protein EDC04DRAFT_2902715 [Pisolithus marmoratus]|nr:hypothetical protein EDC04DRAFT_2902715 [Pisolithus marmoratus]